VLQPESSPVYPMLQTHKEALAAATDSVVENAVHVLQNCVPAVGLYLPWTHAAHPEWSPLYPGIHEHCVMEVLAAGD